MYVSIGSISIDDIVLPDGQTRMGVLGGGSTHAAMGMRVWSDRVGLAAAIGPDFPEGDRLALKRVLDLRGLMQREAPTPRAWELYESDGRRTEVARSDPGQFLDMCSRPDEFPAEYAGASGVRLDSEAPGRLREWVALLRARRCACILWEPWIVFCQPHNRGLFAELAPLVDIVSPNLLEARRLTGLEEPRHILGALLDAGARIVALRMGESGSLVATTGQRPLQIPALPVARVVDVTGAGNAYCGGFVVGLAETGDLATAGRYGAVSASFALEQYGVVYPDGELRARAMQRLSAALEC